MEHRWALSEAFEWRTRLGAARVEQRTHALARRLKEGLAGARHLALVTPREQALSAGLVMVIPFGADPDCTGATLRIGHDRAGQPVTYAVDFRESAPRPVFCRRSMRWCHRGGNDLAAARVAVSPMDRTAGRDRALAVHHNATPNTPTLRYARR